MRLTHRLALLAIFSLSAAALHAQGVVMVQKETRNGQSTTSRIQMDKDHIRAEAREGADETAFVFDGPKKVARMINMSNKTYQEIGAAEMQQMRGQMDSMMTQVQAQMANMPPAQRAMIEQMMQGRGGAGMPGMPAGMPGMPTAPTAAAKLDYKQTGSDKVGQWTCTKYEAVVGGQKASEVCTVDPKELGLSAGDFDAARQLAELLKPLMPTVADRMVLAGTVQNQGYAGIPVRRTSFRNGAVESVSEITEVQHTAIPASTFDAPAGFKKEAMPGMGR